MTRTPSGHIEQLPSGSWRAKVYAGTDPLTGREIRFRKTRKTEVEAQIELGKLLALARAGHQPDSDVTVAELLVTGAARTTTPRPCSARASLSATRMSVACFAKVRDTP
jgi:hypothetical protein